MGDDKLNRFSRRKTNVSRFNNLRIIIFLLKIILLISHTSKTEEKQRNMINLSSEIHLIIKGNRTQILINDSFYLQPSEVIVNGIYRNSCKIFCDMEYEENNVTLIFKETLNSSQNMFSGLNNIKEIDLSFIDFSQVTTMNTMFRYCSNLEKINFGNINTSSVVNMGGLFYN